MGRILHAQQEGWELNGAKLLPVKNHGAEGKEDGDSGGLLSRSQCCLVPYLCAAGLGDGDVPPTSVPRAPGVEGHQGPQGLHRPLPWKKKKTRHVTWVCRDREVPGTLLFCARLTYAETQCQLVAGPQRPAEGELQQESLPSAHHQARRFVRIRVVLDRVLALQEVNVGDLQVALWKIVCGEGEKKEETRRGC